MTIEWREHPAFPGYLIWAHGVVTTVKTNRTLRPSLTTHGHLKVNLSERGKVRTRQINQLVAEAFLERPIQKGFNFLIHLDGDKTNCAAENLAWRPRYFAIAYHQQFETPMFYESRVAIRDVTTREEYETAQDAVIQHGLLLRDILSAVHANTYVWPTYQIFEFA